MDPEQSQIPGLPLPQSQAPAGGYTFAAPPEPSQSASMDDDTLPTTAQPAVAPADTHAAVPPIIAAAHVTDEDDIEEVDEIWIDKAREIVHQTQDDPYTQTRALARLKADFLKNRYGKDSKLSEDVAK